MNWLDIVLIIALVIALFGGLRNGIIRGIISLVGIIVGVVLAGNFYIGFAENFAFFQNEGIARIVSFAIILVVVIAAFFIIGSVIKKVVSSLMLGWIDHLVGAVFGFIIGGIFLGAILVIWIKYLGESEVFLHSFMAGVLIDIVPLALALLPSEFDSVRSFFQQ